MRNYGCSKFYNERKIIPIHQIKLTSHDCEKKKATKKYNSIIYRKIRVNFNYNSTLPKHRMWKKVYIRLKIVDKEKRMDMGESSTTCLLTTKK